MAPRLQLDTTKEWTGKTIHQFEGMKAYILGGAFMGDMVVMFAEAGFQRASSVKEADVVVFTGGADINPTLYNQKPHRYTSFSQARDDIEVAAYKEAQDLGKVCLGICRGAQFLHAMNGGELWQHVTGHGGREHWIIDIDDDVKVLANSYHHQMLKINDSIELVAVCEDQISRTFMDDKVEITLAKDDDSEIEIEAGRYVDTKCFFVQGHPEVDNEGSYKSWFFNKVKDFMEDVKFEESYKVNRLEGNS